MDIVYWFWNVFWVDDVVKWNLEICIVYDLLWIVKIEYNGKYLKMMVRY